jgi:hypothetical protein
MLEDVMTLPSNKPHHKFGCVHPPLLISLKCKFMSKKLSLSSLVEQVKRQATEGLSFNIENVETKVSKSGNVGVRAECTNGTIITFWSTNMDQVVEAIDDNGTYQVIAGTKVLDDGSLIPSEKASTGKFWD